MNEKKHLWRVRYEAGEPCEGSRVLVCQLDVVASDITTAMRTVETMISQDFATRTIISVERTVSNVTVV